MISAHYILLVIAYGLITILVGAEQQSISEILRKEETPLLQVDLLDSKIDFDLAAEAPLSSHTIVTSDDGFFDNDIEITQELYDRLVYFSKICALSYCITSDELSHGKTFAEGGCPARLKFCSDEEDNPTIHRTRIELVLLAAKNELGTGYVAVDHEKRLVMLVFRGSTTKQDWFSDFLIYPVHYLPSSLEYYEELVHLGDINPCSDCMLYSGFHLFLRTLSSHFFERIEKISVRYPDYKLVVTGHSLGAALATLAGIELKLRGYDPWVVTYACPHIFNGALRDWVDELFKSSDIHTRSLESKKVIFERGYFRVVHMQDYITMIPPFYQPAGLEIFVKKLFLPHGLEDLVYKGFQPGLLLPQPDPDGVTGSGNGQGHKALGLAEKWLHMYEHRAYFILINTCDDF